MSEMRIKINGELGNIESVNNTHRIKMDNGSVIWVNNNGDFHNLSGPAVIWVNGHKEWYLHGRLHNLRGPAIINADGIKKWWISGIEYSEEEFNKIEKI